MRPSLCWPPADAPYPLCPQLHAASHPGAIERQTSFGRVELLEKRLRVSYHKEIWPSAEACSGCHVGPASAGGTGKHAGGKAHTGSSRSPEELVRHLHRTYCLEPHFECWAEKHGRVQRWMGPSRATQKVVGGVLALGLLAWLCCAAWVRDQREETARMVKSAESMA